MKAVNWDALTTSAPINKDAALARDGGGEAPMAPANYPGARSHAPLPTRRVPHGTTDRTGARFGRLVVIGLHLRSNDDRGRWSRDAWVVRCDCGTYETRRSETVDAAREDACCADCVKLTQMRQRGVSGSQFKTPFQRPPRVMEALPTRETERSLLASENLTGQRFGRFTVVGLYDDPNRGASSSKPARWVVRCDCGAFEARRAKVLRASTDEAPIKCEHCSLEPEAPAT